MAALRRINMLVIAACLVSAAELKIITAEPGQTVILPCQAPDDKPVIAAQWRRTDLRSPEYVLSYRDDRSDPDHQHPSFQNRVDLQDRKMKDGNVSLFLRNVMSNDTGTYECHVFQKNADNIERATDPTSRVHLKVSPSGLREDRQKKDAGDNNGSVGLTADLALCFVVVVFNIINII